MNEARAVDIGTGTVVGARMEKGKELFSIDRDAFYAKQRENFNAEMAKKSGMAYIEYGENIYIIGEDAFRFAHITGDLANYHRPMARGVLNPGEDEAIAMVEILVERAVGKAPKPGTPCAVTCPASPLDADFDIIFHRAMVTRFLQNLQYAPLPINEALGVIYAENPTTTENGVELPFTGLAVSFGAGMVNMVLAWRGEPLLEASVARGGDWIDQEVSKATNRTVAAVTYLKENRLNLAAVDPKDKVQVALMIYYQELCRYAFHHFDRLAKSKDIHLDVPITAVFAGGTALVNGFTTIAHRELAQTRIGGLVADAWPAKDPLKAPVQGALAYALSKEK